ncbi:MAG: hypothetical protein ACE5GH_04060, partial [Fidelibacterota bacterium]
GGISVASRIMGGFMKSDNGGVPIQEKYTVHGAGSGDYFSKPYLRHPSSLTKLKVGDEYLRNRIHLYGDANLRGYYAHGYSGAEKVISGSVEVTRGRSLSWMRITLRSFFDGGWLWSDADGLEGNLLADSGLGMGFERKIAGANLKLRIDWPIWLNYTQPGVKTIDVSRWVIGIDGGL